MDTWIQYEPDISRWPNLPIISLVAASIFALDRLSGRSFACIISRRFLLMAHGWRGKWSYSVTVRLLIATGRRNGGVIGEGRLELLGCHDGLSNNGLDRADRSLLGRIHK